MSMKVAWVCEYPASLFPDRPALQPVPPSHPVPWVVVQAPRVAQSGIELHIITLSKHITRDDEFVSDGMHFHFLKIPAVPRAALAYQWDRKRIHDCLRAIRPALVQGFGTESSFGYSAVSSPFPSVLMIQGIVSKITRVRGWTTVLSQPGLVVALLIEWLTVRRARHVICETAFAERFVREHNSNAIVHRIHTPVRDHCFDVTRRPSEPARPEILFVGWVVPAKGIDVLLQAFAGVVKVFPEATLHVVGPYDDQYYREVLGPEVERLGLARLAHFYGHQPAAVVTERLATAAVFALPTLMDTAPNVIAEARAAGVPVVASAVGGIPELVDDGVDGVLVPPGDAGRLCAAILALLRDSERAAAVSRRGRERALRDHRASTQVPKLLTVYQDILATTGSSGR